MRPTTYKTKEQKYLFETYANEEGIINQAIIDRLSDMLSNDVYVRPEGESDYKTKATNAEKKFLAQLIGAGLWAIRDGNEFYSVANALEYMFIRWNSENERDLNSYLTFYCPLARLCGKGQKVELQ